MTTADWLDEVRRVLDHVRVSDAIEVQIEAPDFRLRLVRRPGRLAISPVVPDVTASETEHQPEHVGIVAPLTGVFYRAPSRDADPYVKVGDHVEHDTVVGLIETMKIFNEIVAERTGRVTAIVAESGQLVHAGETLMRIENLAEPGSDQNPRQVTP